MGLQVETKRAASWLRTCSGPVPPNGHAQKGRVERAHLTILHGVQMKRNRLVGKGETAGAHSALIALSLAAPKCRTPDNRRMEFIQPIQRSESMSTNSFYRVQ